jgi:hypothetical protein
MSEPIEPTVKVLTRLIVFLAERPIETNAEVIALRDTEGNAALRCRS